MKGIPFNPHGIHGFQQCLGRTQKICLVFENVFSANYSDRSPPVGHPKWWFSKGIHPTMPLIQVQEL